VHPETKTAFEQVRKFWFGDLDSNGQSDSAHASAWWKKDEHFDSQIRTRFGGLHSLLMKGEHLSELENPGHHLAAVIVLDQFSRNMFRGTPAMFASDQLALDLTRRGLERQMDAQLALEEKTFFYMPLMHNEDLGSQNRVVELFEALFDSAPTPAQARLRNNVKAAHQHRAIIAKWGRFPHRNAILGRDSTDAELEFLRKPGSSF